MSNIVITPFISLANWYDLDTVNMSTSRSVKAATVAGLHPAYSYVIRVMAVNVIGMSDPSEEVSYTTQTEGTATGEHLIRITTILFYY